MKAKKPFYKKMWFWAIILFVAIIGSFVEEEPVETASTNKVTPKTEKKVKSEESKVDPEEKFKKDLEDTVIAEINYLNFSLGGNTSGRIDIEIAVNEGMIVEDVHQDIFNTVKLLKESKVRYYDVLIQVFRQDELAISLIYNKGAIKDIDMATFAVNDIYQVAVRGEKYRYVHPDYVISF